MIEGCPNRLDYDTLFAEAEDGCEDAKATLAQVKEIREDCEHSTLIHHSDLHNWCADWAEEIGAIRGDEGWPLNCIDWHKAARELIYGGDVSAVYFRGQVYYLPN